jgi:hypothetical protein
MERKETRNGATREATARVKSKAAHLQSIEEQEL